MSDQVLVAASRMLREGQAQALSGKTQQASASYRRALGLLRDLPPDRLRDVLLAYLYLAEYQTLGLAGHEAEDCLVLGVSYARTTRDPLARAIAEECLSGLQR